MKLADFNYTYPEDLVAQRPLAQRDASKMLVVDRAHKSFVHSSIQELPNLLNEGDLLVVNNSKVFSSRLFGKKTSGSQIEFLLLKEINSEKQIWSTLSTRKKRIKVGDQILFDQNLSAKVLEKREDDLLIQFSTDHDLHKTIEKIGLPPLPPYIKREAREDYTDEDRKRYQTLYAKHVGSAAAPTAGFHLTDEIMAKCKNKGVEIAEVTLHVGLDTFSPVRVEEIKDHKMHGEAFFISAETIAKIDRAKKKGRRVVAVGTTTVRALEAAAHVIASTAKQSSSLDCFVAHAPRNDSSVEPQHPNNPTPQHTELFIAPGYKFKVVDAVLTNFHQPKSTLIMMISAFAEREFILKMYAEAIKERYRLFSYGDCMLII